MALAGLSPIALEKFGGLDLQQDPEEVSNGALDALNVMYDRAGSRVRSRPGYTSFYSTTGTPRWIARSLIST